MFNLSKSIRQTADIIGTLVYSEGERKYVKISYEDAVTTMSSDGWPLFAGLDVRVK